MERVLKNTEIINAITSLVEIKKDKIKLPTNVSWNFNKNLKRLTSAAEDFYKEEGELIKEYAIKDEKGNVSVNDKQQYSIPKESIKPFTEKMNELYQQEDIVDLLMVNISDLEKYEIDMETLDAIAFMIEDDSE